MYPWLRLIRVLFTVIGKPRIDLLGSARIQLRVWPNDLDLNLHVNNARYLAMADIARAHWAARTGIFAIARKKRALFIVGDVLAKFRHGLKAFENVEIETRLLGWDRKWGYVESRFIRNDRVIGIVAIRGVLQGAKGRVDADTILGELSISGSMPSPPLPTWTRDFHGACEAMSELLREEEFARGLRDQMLAP